MPCALIVYDANGNTLTDASGKTYTWDFENRLVQAVVPGTGTANFKYDPFGRRIQKSGPLGTTNYVYDGVNLSEEIDQNGNILARYTQNNHIDEPLAELRSGTTSYYQADGLGSITSLSNGADALANTYSYDSFGKLIASTGTVTNPFQYTGREFDPETGLRYYRGRYYDPNVGRFLSEDPLGIKGGLNFYSYVRNSPTTFIDPAGLVQIIYSTNYNQLGWWESLWVAGQVQIHYRWHGTCTKNCDDTWKLNLTLSITLDVSYSSDSNRKHEQGHADVAQAFFNNNKSHYEAFELTFGSEAECEDYLRHRLNSDMLYQLQIDQAQLDQAQDNYDGFWGWLFNHAF
jgi:RHS repeat-associated protein